MSKASSAQPSGSVKIVRCPRKDDLRLTRREKAKLRRVFEWERRSSDEFVLGVPQNEGGQRPVT